MLKVFVYLWPVGTMGRGGGLGHQIQRLAVKKAFYHVRTKYLLISTPILIRFHFIINILYGL